MTLSFVARNVAFNLSEVRARSGATVTVVFRNEDAGVDHDISFGIAGLGHGHTCTGPCQDQYSFTAPAPGTYAFFCTVHAAMTGTFIVDP